MSFRPADFQNPKKMYEMRTRSIRVRIQNLESDLALAKHPFSRAVIKQELDRSIDEYVSRSIQQ